MRLGLTRPPLLTTAFGHRQVRGRTFSQTGGFSDVRVDGDIMRARGPNPVYPDVTLKPIRKLTGEFWENKLFIIPVTGQSRANGAGVGGGGEATEVSDLSADGGIRTWFPPMPGKALYPAGGSFPNPDGASSPGQETFWPLAVYDKLIDATEGINYLRTPGRETYREPPFMAMLLHFAAALPDSSKAAVVNGALGSSNFAAVWGTLRNISGYTWSAANGGELTFAVVADHSVRVGEKSFVMTGVNPSAANGTYEVTAVVHSHPTSYVTVKCPVEPPAWVSGGRFTNRATSLQSVFAACGRIKEIAADLGLTPEVYAVAEMGHEGDSTIDLYEWYLATIQLLDSEAVALQAAVNPESTWVPWKLLIGVDWARNNWTDREAKIGEGSWWTYGAVRIVRQNLIERVAVVPTHWAQSGLGTPIGTPHNGSYGSQRFGTKFGHVLVDIGLGIYSLPGILTAHRNVGSPNITFTLNGASVKDTTEVWDDAQGCGGVQLFNGDIDTEYLRKLTEVSMASVALDGTSAVASGTPDPRRNFIGTGFKMALQTAPWCGRGIVGASWDGTTVSLELAGAHAHNLPVGMGTRFFKAFDAPNNGIMAITVAAGSTGNVVKFARATDPGVFTPGGSMIQSGNFCIGNHYGNRVCYRRVVDGVPDHSYIDGAPIYDYWPIDLIPVRVDPSSAWADAETEIRAEMLAGPRSSLALPRFKISLDPANSACIASGNASVVNLGSTGTDESYNIGTGSGTDGGDFNHSGTYGSKKRDGYLVSPLGTSRLSPVNSSLVTTGANMHKAWSVGSPNNGVGWGLAFGRYATGSSAQYLWSTCPGEGSTVGAGAQLRFSNHRPQLIIRNDGNSTVWSLTATTVLATGDYYVIAWFFRNGGQSWLWVNGERVFSTTTPFTSPATGGAKNKLMIAINTDFAGATSRPTAANHQWGGLELSDEWPGFDLEFGDLEPYINGGRKRMLENAYD